jgi:SPP1 gp7 family putative phage head morphogenesis protein
VILAAQRTVNELAARRMVGTLRPRRVSKVPRQAYPKAIEVAYAKAIRSVLARVRVAFAPLLEAMPTILESAARERARGDAYRADAGEGKRVRELADQAAARLRETLNAQDLDDLAEEFARRTSSFQRIQLNNQTRAVLGADVFVNDAPLRNVVDDFAAENAALIKGVANKTADDIAAAATRAVANGTSAEDLAKEIETRFSLGEKRSKAIARDQIGKLNGQITAERHKAMGVKKFRWRTAGDERVRGNPEGKYPKAEPSHWHLEESGEIYEYDNPPESGVNGERQLPGVPIFCRCYPEPVFDDILSELDAL